MKRKVLGLTMAVFVAALPVFVNAEEVDSTKFNDCVTATGSKTCTLTEDVAITSTVEVTGNIILDLAGYEITSDATTAIKVVSGSLTVKDTSTESTGKIEVSGEAFRIGTKGNTDDDKDSAVLTIEKEVDVVSTNDSCVVIYAGTLNTAGNLITEGGNYATVTGSGNDHGTIINITDGSIIHETNLAIYHPQTGKLNISGGTITGATGIEMRAGELTVTGGTITGTYKPTEYDSNGNGSTTMGAGIAIAQHTTKLAIKVTISGGVIEGYTALHEVTTEEGITAEDIKKISVTISGGTFNTINDGINAIYSENKVVTISDGEFSGELPEEITTPEGYEVYTVETSEGDTKYVVATEEVVENLPYEEEVSVTVEELKEELETLKEELGKVNEEELTEEELKEYQELKKIVTILEGKTVVSLHNIFYGSFIDGNYVINSNQSELKEAVKITLELPEDLPKVKEGYVRKYSVLRAHMNANHEIEYTELPATEKNGEVTFETDKFSEYILMYEDVANTKNPNTFDGISLYMIIGFVSLIGLVSVIAYSKKAKNY